MMSWLQKHDLICSLDGFALHSSTVVNILSQAVGCEVGAGPTQTGVPVLVPAWATEMANTMTRSAIFIVVFVA